MNLENNKVVITGGATGIGLGIAEIFLNAGSKVIICGRRQEALNSAVRKHPTLISYQCDVSSSAERTSFIGWLKKNHPDTNVFVNNAGIQERINISDRDFMEKAGGEIAINLEAPIHLSYLALDLVSENKNPVLINVTSGLAFVPLTIAPVYSATKAALHSFTLSFRHLVKSRGIQVLEIIPPAVNTDLGGPGLHNQGVPLTDFIVSIGTQLRESKVELTYGFSEKASNASREELDTIFSRLNSR